MPRNGSATRERILDAAERLLIENGFAATSVDEVIAASGSSKGAFFHHFPSKLELARELVDRYARADIAHLEQALVRVRRIDDPSARVIEFLRLFEDDADDLMAAQSSCLYVSVLTERQLASSGTADSIVEAILAWRRELSRLIHDALAHRRGQDFHADDLADHVFVTFEGAFLLCRSTGDPSHMRAQLRALRQLFEALLGVADHRPGLDPLAEQPR